MRWRSLHATLTCLALGAAPWMAGAAQAAGNASPALCRSGSVSILVGGVAADQAAPVCDGFGRDVQSGKGVTGGGTRAAHRDRPAVNTFGSKPTDDERQAILEAELQQEMARLKETEQGTTEALRQAASRSRANIDALRREMARSPGYAAR